MTDNDEDAYRPLTFARSVLDALTDDTTDADDTDATPTPRPGLRAPKEGRTAAAGDTAQQDKRDWLRAFNDPTN